MWRTVLDLSLVDLLRGPNVFQRYAEDIDEGITWSYLMDWFDPEDNDFQAVCYLSQLEPHLVYRKMDEIVYLGLIPEHLK